MRSGFLHSSLLAVLSLLFSSGCSRGSGNPDEVGEVVAYAPVAVSKTVTKKVFVHLMPWFETKESNKGSWGIHWTMSTRDPDRTDAGGKREIAAHFYPLTGPYASGDTTVIDYQLLLMKLSGIDGVLIDWPGRQTVHDYPLLVKNTAAIVSRLDRVGLRFAIVYEDQNLVNAVDKVATAKSDISWLQQHYFPRADYEKMAGKPLLLDFGPQVLQNAADWTAVFSGLNPRPSFFTLWFESGEAGANAAGEFAWIPRDHLTTLNAFYANGYPGIKIGAAYPGFYSFYAEGGWSGPTWSIPHNGTATFLQTLDLALEQPGIDYVQLATWNDYGEGTMIEPTREFGYDFLIALQQRLGVENIGKQHLEMVAEWYRLKKERINDRPAKRKLDQVFYDLVSLQLTKAEALLDSFN